MLLSMGKQRHAVQLLQFHVPPDSLRLARMLLGCEEFNDPPQAENTRKAIIQAAIDMMMRLQAYNEVVLELLKHGRLMAAMRVVLRHRHRFVRDAAVAAAKHGADAAGGTVGEGGAPTMSTLEPSIPKEAFFRVAVAQLRATAKRVEGEEKLRAALMSSDGDEGGGGGGSVGLLVGCGGSAGGGCRLETLHAVYAFYRELWPFLLQPILKYAGGGNGNASDSGEVGGSSARKGVGGAEGRGGGGKHGDSGGDGAAATQISTLAASISFPEDLFDDHRVSAMYRSLFGFAPVSRR
jgi:hypothetical protein